MTVDMTDRLIDLVERTDDVSLDPTLFVMLVVYGLKHNPASVCAVGAWDDDGNIQGFVVMFPPNMMTNYAYIAFAYIHPKLGKQVSDKIWAMLKERARQWGADKIRMTTHRLNRKRAFEHRFGFRLVGYEMEYPVENGA